MEIPIPEDEFNRLLQLAEYDLDNSNLESNLKDLTKLAAKVAGTNISLVNLIDAFTQWSVAGEGLPVMQTAREDSVCQYTIMGNQPLEIRDLTKDERFNRKPYVTGNPNLKYYWGVPLKNDSGYNLGALCVLDTESKYISPEKVDLLEIIADEIVNRLKIIKAVAHLQSEVKNEKEKQKQVAHDIRGPIGGIIGLAQIIKEQGDNNQLEDVLEFIKVIQSSGKSLLELADEILTSKDEVKKRSETNPENKYNLLSLKEKLENLYGIQGKQKEVNLTVEVNSEHKETLFPKAKLLQILGNLISNAIKFTPPGGEVTVDLNLQGGHQKELLVMVKDTGEGMTPDQIEAIMNGEGKTTEGTSGEKGYGFGLPLVKHLIDGMGGTINIDSKPGAYSCFKLLLPV